jgi:hypothetical protein
VEHPLYDLDRLLRGSHPQPEPAHAIDADGEGRKLAAATGALDPAGHRQPFLLRRAHQEPKTLQGRSRQFEHPVALVFANERTGRR